MQHRYLVGGALLLAGAVLLLSALWPAKDSWQVERVPLTIPDDLVSHHPPSGFERLEIQHCQTGKRLTLHLAHYRDASGSPLVALLPEPGSRQWQAWMELAQVLRTLESDALVLAWWDGGQRVDFLSGRAVWVRRPPENAFASEERSLWHQIIGSFEVPQAKLAQLAKWLTGTSEQAVGEISRLEPGTPLYLLVSNDDLAHLDEIERLADRKLPLEVRIFPSTGNFHSRIAAVQRWAQETGGSYLPQKVPGGIAAWRTVQDGTEPFLARLLPFTASLDKPLPGLEQVYRTSDGYLTLYRRR